MATRKKATAPRSYGPGNVYSLTDEHRALLPEWRDKWIAIALRTRSQDADDKQICADAVRGMYAAAKLKEPRLVFVPSPIVGAQAWCFASVWIWLREHPEKHADLFGRLVTEAEIAAGVALASEQASRIAHGLPPLPWRTPPVAATDAATYAATYAATWDATSAATRDATEAATSAATSAATRDATYAATDAATYAATSDATRAATYAATDAATYAATWDATRDATRAATRDATYAATSAATSAATRDATYAATYAATSDATDAATSDATSDATDAATSDATSAATSDATMAATSAATKAATSAATRAATRDATEAATWAATSAATSAATKAATDAATSDATSAATRDATRDATYAATYAATSDATSDATYAATDAATYAATSAATYAATSAATYAATSDATSAATSAATRDATEAATRDAAEDPIARLMLASLAHWSRGWNGGNHWAGWCSYLSFFREVASLGLPQYDVWIHYERAATHGCHRYMHRDFCLVSDFPEHVKRDERNAPHSASGPSIRYRDGWAAYYWRGTAVPREWIESPKTVDPRLALTHPQIEQRRALAEIIGWAKVLGSLDAKTIDRDSDPEIGELIEVQLPDAEGRDRFLRVRCGTGREFALPVPPTMRTALEANAWTYGIDAKEYRPEVRT